MGRWVSLLVLPCGFGGLILGLGLLGGGVAAVAFAFVWGLILVPLVADRSSRRALDPDRLSQLETHYWRTDRPR